MMCSAQERELAGTVLDTAGRPIGRVLIVDLSRSDSSTKTESDGSFEKGEMPGVSKWPLRLTLAALLSLLGLWVRWSLLIR
jgi:hypothetical protein